MSRIVSTENSARDRDRLIKWIVYTMRELLTHGNPDEKSLDMTAFIIICLREIGNSINPSVEAWEKRGYWVKADRYRMEWEWTTRYASLLERDLLSNDWAAIALSIAQIGQKLANTKLPAKLRTTPDWTGAYKQLIK